MFLWVFSFDGNYSISIPRTTSTRPTATSMASLLKEESKITERKCLDGINEEAFWRNTQFPCHLLIYKNINIFYKHWLKLTNSLYQHNDWLTYIATLGSILDSQLSWEFNRFFFNSIFSKNLLINYFFKRFFPKIY